MLLNSFDLPLQLYFLGIQSGLFRAESQLETRVLIDINVSRRIVGHGAKEFLLRKLLNVGEA